MIILDCYFVLSGCKEIVWHVYVTDDIITKSYDTRNWYFCVEINTTVALIGSEINDYILKTEIE